MNSVHRTVRRIRQVTRRLRPPNSLSRSPNPRYFTQHGRFLFMVSPGIPRPQLPFLHSPSQRLAQQGKRGGQLQVTRYISTKNKIWLKEQVKLGVKYGLYGWAIFACIVVAGFGWDHERLERLFPSPPEWTWWTRIHFRHGKGQEDPKINANKIIDWAMASSAYRQALERLEDVNKDGKDIVEQEGEGLLVDGVGQTGYDISAKSEPWRRGYWETLMGCGRSAQHLDGWVKDVTRNISFPAELVIGPSNPNPRPCPPNTYPAPLEENCVPSFPPPETFYLKILTTRGFTTGQRMQAAIAYGDWLEFKGLHESAEELYRWALDIAASGVTDAESIIDIKTGILRESAPTVTSNLLQAATALATHFAQRLDTASALPIYASVLRARRSAPQTTEVTKPAPTRFSGPLSTVVSLLKSPDYPPAPPTGDEPLVRDVRSDCEDAVLMSYIGEVLFASSVSQQLAGLAWTRNAVEMAERVAGEESIAAEVREKCTECAELGLTNWVSMLRTLSRQEKERETRSKPQAASWKSWIGLGLGRGAFKLNWVEEEREVERRLAVYRERSLKEQYGAMSVLGPGFGK